MAPDRYKIEFSNEVLNIHIGHGDQKQNARFDTHTRLRPEPNKQICFRLPTLTPDLLAAL